MYDAISKAAGASDRTFKARTVRARFSPSYGVHKGYIQDPNWPPAFYPEDRSANARRSLRIDCAFEVVFSEGAARYVQGDLSRGGARFIVPSRLDEAKVAVLVKDDGASVRARADVLSCAPKGDSFEYRARFADPTEGEAVWTAMLAQA